MGVVTRFSPARAAAWFAVALAMAALGYSSKLLSEDGPDEDVLFQWSTAISSVVVYALILAAVLAISEPVERTIIGLRRPPSWGAASGWIVLGFAAILALAAVLAAAGLDAGDEQGLVPKEWDPARAAPFVANFVVVAVVAPIVEELVFRGVGFAVVRQLAGTTAAVVVTSVLFGLAHGLVVALPILVFFGLVLAAIRSRTQSVYPPTILHGIFNALALTAGVTGVGS